MAKSLARARRPEDRDARKRLLHEAAEFLERVVQMDAPAMRHGWAWFNLSQVYEWLGRPRADIMHALHRALELVPTEERFRRALQERARGGDRAE